MFSVISPSQFKTVPWKNGKGETTELAINQGGSLDNFEWRLSIASVVENGEFSDFSGYDRNLVLIQGQGIQLQHDESKLDSLDERLDLASFDGASKTLGTLKGGAIKDLNLITSHKHFRSKVTTYCAKQNVTVAPCSLCFIYSLTDTLQITSTLSGAQTLALGHLMQIVDLTENLLVSGKDMIVMQLHSLG